MIHFVYSLISFLIAIFFILTGFIGILIPWSEVIRTQVINLISDHSVAISLFGFALIAIGIAVAVQILLSTRTTYYKFTVAQNPVTVDEGVVQHYLNEYWNEIFPGKVIPCYISIKNNRIHVTADLPYVQQSEQAELLKKIQAELTELFTNLLNYRQEFYLNLSFCTKEKPSQAALPAQEIGKLQA